MKIIDLASTEHVVGGVIPAAILAKGAVDCALGAVGGGAAYFGAKAADGGEISPGGVLISIFGGCAANLASGGTSVVVGTGTAIASGVADGYYRCKKLEVLHRFNILTSNDRIAFLRSDPVLLVSTNDLAS